MSVLRGIRELNLNASSCGQRLNSDFFNIPTQSDPHVRNMALKRLLDMTKDNEKKIEIINLRKWMEMAVNGDIVLPMIQRGSVWKPHQILDLWDTLLRRMPIGAMMTSEAEVGTKVFNLTTRKTQDARPNAVNLLDGQQRVLAILAAWPGIADTLNRPVTVWIDLGDAPQGEYHFRLLATTRAQPFGYERIGMGGQILSKLTSWERRLANAAYPSNESTENVIELWNQRDFMPWKAKFALRLSSLIENNDLIIEDEIQYRISAFERRLAKVNADSATVSSSITAALARHFSMKLTVLRSFIDDQSVLPELERRRKDLLDALSDLPNIQFPVIPIAKQHIEEDVEEDNNSSGDPPLAVLFKRVGSGGQSLSNEDYIFSVIKHRAPIAHDLVETLLGSPSVAALYTPNDLVMAGVRVTLLDLRQGNSPENLKRAFVDRLRMDKSEFAKLIRKNDSFLKTFTDLIAPGGKFSVSLLNVLNAISYSEEFPQGIPRHGLTWLVERSLLDVILAWAFRALENSPLDKEHVRLQIVRFLLWGRLCINNLAKASERCMRIIDDLRELQDFPENTLIGALIEEGIARPLPSPQNLQAKELNGLIFSDRQASQLRGWTRFDYMTYPSVGEKDRYKIDIYRRWWNLRGRGHQHPFLLWLQRELVVEHFETFPALAGMEEETPYDFDHLLPYKYWGDFRGSGIPKALLSDDGRGGGRNWIGNALGNMRIWPSADNRSDGDSLPHLKLSGEDVLRSSLIETDQPWFASDFEIADGVDKYWASNPGRASDFQAAVEMRTFALYKAFFTDLNFEDLAETFSNGMKFSK